MNFSRLGEVRIWNITMYRLMLVFMLGLAGAAILLSAIGVLPFSAGGILLQASLFAAVCWLINTAFARALKIPANIESSLITGLILALIVGPLTLPGEWLVIVVTAGVAMASKYILVWRKSHVFNPAALGAAAGALLLGYPASWWIGNQALVPVVLVGGIIMLAKIRRWHLVFSFLGAYLGLIILNSLLIQGRSLAITGTLVQNIGLATPVLFFSFVMLIEPLTAPQTRGKRILFGLLVGFLLFFFQRVFVQIPYSLELALLAGNVFARVINPDFRQAFTLKRKELPAPDIGSFWFEPTREFSFQPGQFLEYTLAHAGADVRGVRRYFSIASSPTEENVLLTARFADKGSTFKETLKKMDPGGEIKASKVAGDFVLPADKGKKLAFIAGGIGITPFRSMVQYLLDTNQSRDIVLLYGAREEKDLVFWDVFEKARERFNMRLMPVLGKMIDEKIIKKEITDLNERTFYISGPEQMVRGVGKILVNMGVARRQIKQDFFPGYGIQKI